MRAVESIDYKAVLADLLDKRAKLDAAIAAIEQFVLGRPVAADGEAEPKAKQQDGPPPAARPEKVEKVQADSFFRMTMADAAKKFLEMSKKPQQAKAIHDAILEGGFTTTAKNFYSNLYTAMMRSDDFVNLGGRKGWGLAEWYPGRPKGRAEDKASAEKAPAKEKATKRVRKAGRKAASKPNGADASPPASPAPQTSASERPDEQSPSDVAN